MLLSKRELLLCSSVPLLAFPLLALLLLELPAWKPGRDDDSSAILTVGFKSMEVETAVDIMLQFNSVFMSNSLEFWLNQIRGCTDKLGL